jgi:hypothetical protein
VSWIKYPPATSLTMMKHHRVDSQAQPGPHTSADPAEPSHRENVQPGLVGGAVFLILTLFTIWLILTIL